MLARGELQTIGATTRDEYRKHLEKDAALERRFQPIDVDEPTVAAHHRDPEGPARPLRGAPPRELHRRRAGRGREPRRPLHQRPVPARQGHRPHRRGRQPHAHPSHDRAARRPRGRREDRRGPPEKESAIDGQDFERAASLRDEERQLPGGAHASRAGVEVRRDGHPVRGRRGGDRRGPVDLDGHPGLQAHRGGDREAAPHGGRAPQADRHPERGHLGRLPRHPPDALRSEGPAPSRPARSSSSGPRASGRPSCRRRSPSSCSATRTR